MGKIRKISSGEADDSVWCHDSEFVNKQSTSRSNRRNSSEAMSRLETALHPALTSDAVEKLFRRKIYTSLSFLETDSEVIVKISGLQYSKVLQIKSGILKKFSSSLVNGHDLFIESVNRCAIVSTGIKGLDALLDGGLTTGFLYELCGSTSSGKSQICMTIAANVSASLKNQQILYLDTKNDVSAHRIAEMIESGSRKVDNIGGVMEKIKICRIPDATGLLSFLHRLSADLNGGHLRLRILIVDSVSAPFLRHLGEGFALLNALACALHYIAVEHHVAVLLTNLVTTWTPDGGGGGDFGCEEQDAAATSQRIQTPMLGKYWAHVPNTRIHVRRLENSDKRLLVIMKSAVFATGKSAHVSITKCGAD